MDICPSFICYFSIRLLWTGKKFLYSCIYFRQNISRNQITILMARTFEHFPIRLSETYQFFSKSKTGEAPLHLCAMNGHVKVVNVLVQDHGASLEAITLENQVIQCQIDQKISFQDGSPLRCEVRSVGCVSDPAGFGSKPECSRRQGSDSTSSFCRGMFWLYQELGLWELCEWYHYQWGPILEV